MIDRRQFLAGSAAILPLSHAARAQTDLAPVPVLFESLYDRLPDDPRFLTYAETSARMRRLAEIHPGLVSTQVIGTSKAGDPIQLVTIAGGPRSALMVAGVHANEAVGSLTSLFLIEQLLGDAALREAMGYTWHFINPIDPDGMAWNRGWLGKPLTPESYFHDFARPALSRQPDYTFPMKIGAYVFDTAPPENLAFRRAIDLTRPDFLYTLHNCEHGGAFFLTSHAFPALEQALAGVPSRFDVLLNPIGEPMSELPARAPGIYAMPMPTAMVEEAVAAGIDPKRVWPAGASSTEYARRYGTFAFVAEVPYWDEPRVFDQGPSDESLPAILRDYAGWMESGGEILRRWRPMLRPAPRQEEFVIALDEFLNSQPRQIAQIRAMLDAGKIPAKTLSIAEALSYRTTFRLITLRPLAILARIARFETVVKGAQEEAAGFIDTQLRAARAEAEFRPLPMRSMVGIQALSGLIAAKMVAEHGRFG